MSKILFACIFLASVFSFSEEEVVTTTTTTSTKPAATTPLKKKYEIQEGSEDISGDKAPLKKTAELNWKKACKEWRAEFKESNKSNVIISHNCGKMECSKEGVESTCVSRAKFKIKTLTEE